MSIEKFVTAMLPEFDKSRIRSDIETARKEIVDIAIPAYTAAEQFHKEHKFKSGMYEQFNKDVKHHVRTSKELISDTLKGLKNVVESLDALSALVDDNFQVEVTSASLTYKKANVLQLISAFSGYSDYAIRLLNGLYIADTLAMTASQYQGSTQREFVFLQKGFNKFVATHAVAQRKAKELTKTLEQAPDVIVDDKKAPAYRQTMGATALSPFATLNFTVDWNPFYHIQIRWEEYQVKRLRASKERKEVLQMRLFALEKQRTGKKDAALEKQIEYTQNRINDLDYQIKEMLEG